MLADAGYGINTAFRTALTRMGLTYAVGIQSSETMRSFGCRDPVRSRPSHGAGQGRPPTLMRRDAQNKPQSARTQLARSLSDDAWRDVAWREGVDKTLHSRFASLRVRPAHRDYWRSQPYPDEWLLVEWPQGESAPTKYWLSTLPADTDLATLVAAAKMRWRIERDYQELKQELGLDHYEGRGWRELSPPHGALRRSLRIPGLRTESRFPPQGDKTRLFQAPLAYPRVIDHADPPIRAERHIKASIATIRIKLARSIARRLPRCPCCQRANL